MAAAPRLGCPTLRPEFEDAVGKYSAFGQNPMMSALFFAMLSCRGNASGQSMDIHC